MERPHVAQAIYTRRPTQREALTIREAKCPQNDRAPRQLDGG